MWAESFFQSEDFIELNISIKLGERKLFLQD